MNRRKMLALSTGLALMGLNITSVEAQTSSFSNSTKTSALPLWFIHEDEIKSGITRPSTKIAKKNITTNRFEGTSQPPYDGLIRKAESVYPSINPGLEVEKGKPLWYSRDSNKIPFNITIRAVNYYFDLAAKDKRRQVTYNVEVTELIPISENSAGFNNLYEIPVVSEISLSLSYSAYYGNVGAEGFAIKKRVFFSKEEIIGLYMPPEPVVYMS